MLTNETKKITEICDEQVEKYSQKYKVKEFQKQNIPNLDVNNVYVVQSSQNATLKDHFGEHQVAKEIDAEQRGESRSEEIIVDSEETNSSTEEPANEDFDIPLPKDQNKRLLVAMENNVKADFGEHAEYMCDNSNAEKRSSLMASHAGIHGDNSPRDFIKCPKCGHLKCEHNPRHFCSSFNESFPEALEHKCTICLDPCADEQAVLAHIQAKHGENLPSHTKAEEFTCFKCAKTFNDKSLLKRHVFSHQKKNVSCEVCNEKFTDGHSLMKHQRSHRKFSISCTECDTTFRTHNSMQIHLRTHTGERPFKCDFCPKAFADGGTLRKHKRLHTKERPYACVVCPRAFNQRVLLRKHIQSKHSCPNPEYTHSDTPYCCTICLEVFPLSEDLSRHLLEHCDCNTALRRQIQMGRNAHKIEMFSNNIEDNVEEDDDTEVRKEQSLSLVTRTETSTSGAESSNDITTSSESPSESKNSYFPLPLPCVVI